MISFVISTYLMYAFNVSTFDLIKADKIIQVLGNPMISFVISTYLMYAFNVSTFDLIKADKIIHV